MKIDLEEVYKKFIPKLGFKGPIGPVQARVMKDVFYGAIGEILSIQKEDVASVTEDEGAEMLVDIWNQVGNHFLKTTNRQN